MIRYDFKFWIFLLEVYKLLKTFIIIGDLRVNYDSYIIEVNIPLHENPKLNAIFGAFVIVTKSLMLSNPADAQNVSCLGLCGRDIFPKSSA